MILVGSNIPMNLAGASHPHKLDAQRLLESALSAGERLVTDAEVRQEFESYAAINWRDAVQPAFDAILGVVDDVLPIRRADALAELVCQGRAACRCHGPPRDRQTDELRPRVRRLSRT